VKVYEIPNHELEGAVYYIPDAYFTIGENRESIRKILEIGPEEDVDEVTDSRFQTWCWNLKVDPYDPAVVSRVIDYAIGLRKHRNEVNRILRDRKRKTRL
jgi:hypothetical protein